MAKNHADPYKSVWDENLDKMADEWNQNSTLFTPSFEDVAFRMANKAKYHLRLARKLAGTADAEVEFNNALSYRRIAKHMLEKNKDVLAKSR